MEMDDEMQDFSFGDLMDLIRNYEEKVQQQQQPFFDEGPYEQIIQFYQDNREWKKAIAVAEHAMLQYPYSSIFMVMKAECLAEQGHYEDALQLLDKARSIDGTDSNAYLVSADVRLMQARHPEALELLEEGLSRCDEPQGRCQLYLQMADTYEDMGLFLEVIQSLKEALHAEPENDEALNRIWYAVEVTEAYADSHDFHKAFIDEYPYNHLAWANLGHAYAGLKDYEEAMEAFSFVIAIEEHSEIGYLCTGDILFLQEKYEEAIGFYEDAIRRSLPNKELFLKTAECYDKLSKSAKARAMIRKALAIDPHFADAMFLMGEIYRREGEYERALSPLQAALKLDPENVDYLTVLGDTCIMLEYNDKALEYFQKALDLEDDNAQNWINLASAYFNIGWDEMGFQLMETARVRFPEEAEVLYVLSLMHFQKNARKRSLFYFEQALQLNYEGHQIITDLEPGMNADPAFQQLLDLYRPAN